MTRVLFVLLLLLLVIAGILSFADIGGDMMLQIARKTLREEYGLELSASGVNGNPVKGYTLRDVKLSSKGGEELFSAKSMSGSINFGALLRGAIRLAEVAVGGVGMDLDTFIREIQNIKLPGGGDGGGMEIPVDRFSLKDSSFTSRWGRVDVAEIGMDVKSDGGENNLDINVDGSVNGIPVKGSLNLDAGAGVVINRSDVGFGRGKILATGGIRPVSPSDRTNNLDLRGTVEGLDLGELTALWPSALKAADYDGTAGVNIEVTGTSETLKITGSFDYRGKKIAGYPVERAGADVRYAGGRVTVNNIQASVLGIPVTGEIAVATDKGQAPSVSVKLDGRDAALEKLHGAFPELKGLKGNVESFSLNIGGSAGALTGTIKISAPRVSYSDGGLNRPLAVTGAVAQVKIVKDGSAVINGKFNLDGAQGYAQGTVASVFASPKPDVTVKLVDMDINRAIGLMTDADGSISGRATLELALKGSMEKPAVSGSITSAAVRAYGLNLKDVKLPFLLSGNSVASSGGAAKLNGGTVRNAFTYDIAKSTFSDRLDADGVGMNALIQDVTGGIGGRITGSGKLHLELDGNVGRDVKYSGRGLFSMGKGAITGFKWLDILTRLHGTKGIQYRDVSAPFEIATGKLIIKSGAAVNSPDNDPLYIYARLTRDGTVNFSGKEPILDMAAEGRINYQLINAIIGGSRGGLAGLGNVLKSGVSGLEDSLRQAIGGALKGARESGSEGDYRVVNLNISGPVSKLSFSGLKIGESTLNRKAPEAEKKGEEKKKEVQPEPQPQQNARRKLEEQVKDRLREEAGKQLKRGLGELLGL